MPRALNVALAWIATAAGVAEILFYLPRSWLITLLVVNAALLTWSLLHKYGISDGAIEREAERRRRELGY